MTKSKLDHSIRIIITAGFMLLCYGLIELRLWNEQIRRGERHRDKISRQSVRKIRLPGVRGRILTGDGVVLADNEPVYNLVFHLAEMRQPGRRSNTVTHVLVTAAGLGRAIGRESSLTGDKVIHHMNTTPGLPMTVFKDLNARELISCAELPPPLAGLEIQAESKRGYPLRETLSHILGYVRRQDPARAEDRDEFFYYQADQVGVRGLEKRYDLNAGSVRGLRGEPGNSLVRVDRFGFVHEEMGSSVPRRNGNDIILTIDSQAQAIAEELLTEQAVEGRPGALVLLDADTGAVLVSASAPAFDLSAFSPRLAPETWRSVRDDPANPLLNRAVNAFTPGSIVKPLVALAALENGVDPLAEIVCDGASLVGDARIRCWSWRSGGHGPVDLISAIEKSCNDYFVETGRKLGLEKVAAVYAAAGIGSETGFDLPEKAGILPSRGLKNGWNEYDTSLISMGQGMITVTPLQAAVYTAAIANGGTIYRPFILKEVCDPDGNVIYRTKPEAKGTLGVSEERLDIIREGMRRVVNAPGGSGRRGQCGIVELRGKTGTAEVGSRINRRQNTWFIAFCEHEGCRYALALLIENGVSGGRTCAPLAARFFQRWLSAPAVGKGGGNPSSL